MTGQSSSGLKFGTSGLRGLAVELEGQPARRYVAAFLRFLTETGQLKGREVLIGHDLRGSSRGIVHDCAAAVAGAGLVAVDCGAVPTPALANAALQAKAPAVMVTGSHIPADRNGLKFYKPSGEITKNDEVGIVAALDGNHIPDHVGELCTRRDDVERAYRDRFVALMHAKALTGLRIGVFEHSTVARDVLADLLERFGASVTRLGRQDEFVAVDTEAFNDAVLAPLNGWVATHRLDALVSSDGDGDRPLMMDESGAFVRGDALGLLTARFLRADTVVTPVTSNSAIERTGFFREVVRTKVGSPYVVAAMEATNGRIVGFEANGGVLVGCGFDHIDALATRDAVLPLLATLGLAVQDGRSVSGLVAELPLTVALADRVAGVSPERSAAFLDRLHTNPGYAHSFFAGHTIARVSDTDGLQFHMKSGSMVHFRPSGNAPELRCYVEASTRAEAASLLQWSLNAARDAVR